jgi:hypothetical protein
MMLYANIYEHRRRNGSTLQFNTAGSRYPLTHASRQEADDAAAWECRVEPRTRRIGLLRIRLKARA